MKKYLIGILIILAVIFVSGCIIGDNSNNENTIQTQTISKNGVMVRYPADWVISQSTANGSLVAISNSEYIDSSKVGQVNVNIQKQKLSGSFDTFLNKTYTAMAKDSSYNLTSSGNISVNGENGVEYMYTSDLNGTLKEHKAVWIEHGDEVYVILCSAPVNEFDSNLKVFNFIIENFQITA